MPSVRARLGIMGVLLLGSLCMGVGNAVFSAEDAMVSEALTWHSLGPDRGGRVTTVAGVPQKPWRFYAGTVGGGVIRTEDAGQTWQPVSSSVFGSASVGAIAVAPSDPNTVYAGMGESTYRSYMSSLGDGVYRSVDGGNTWTDVGLKDSLRIGSIVVDPKDSRLVYVAAMGNPWAASSARGLYRTADGGEHWERVLSISDTTSAVDVSMDPIDSNTLYVSTWDNLRSAWYLGSGGPGSGIFKSQDGGRSWRRLTVGLPTLMGKIGVAVSPADANRIYALVEATPTTGGLYVSDDRGEHWRLVNSADHLWNRAWYYMQLRPDPTRRDRVWVMCTQLWRSDDGGKNFTSQSTPHGDNHALWINPDDPRIMVEGSDGGATVTLNGGTTWSSLYNQRTGQFYRVSVDSRVPYNVLGAQQDWDTVSVRSRDNLGGPDPAVAYDLGGGEGGYVVADPFDPNVIYAGSELGYLSRFDRRTGVSTPIVAYPRFPEGIEPRNLRYRFQVNAPLVASVHTPGTIYHAAQKVLRSRDRGQSWTEISPDLTRNDASKQGPGGGPFTNERINAFNVISTLAESTLDAAVLWAGTDDGRLQVTRDQGNTWRDVTPPGIEDGQFYTVTTSSSSAGGALAALTRHRAGDMRPHLFVTYDFGSSWKTVSATLPQATFARVLREDPIRPAILYAGTEQGVYVTFDSGTTWRRLGAGLPTTPVTGIVCVEDDLVISTEGSGFWVLSGLSTLRQSTDGSSVQGKTRLFAPAVAFTIEGTPSKTSDDDTADSADAGIDLDAVIGERDRVDLHAIRLEILGADGRVVRTLLPAERETDAKPETGAKPAPGAGGLLRIRWDLSTDRLAAHIEGALDGTLPGVRAPPGTYRARLRTPSVTMDVPVEVRLNPSLPQPTAKALADKQYLIARIQAVFANVATTVNAEAARRSNLQSRGQTQEAAQLVAWEHQVFDRRLIDSQARVNLGGGLLFDLKTLEKYVDDSQPPLPVAMLEMCEELEGRWRALRGTLP